MRNRVVLISKDVLMKSYLPVYGNTYYRTPNIDALARSGTVFLRHYTAAPSTAMAFTSMFTGLYGYQTNRRKYVEVSDFEGDTLFDIMNRNGYSCHVVWDVSYRTLAQKYSKCYGSNTKIHNTTFLTRKQPAHVWGQYDDMSFHAGLEDECVLKTEELTKQICESSEKVFMWIHLPHALLGRNAYGSDIDLLDRMVGVFRKYFDDSSIYLTADHGHMNGAHGKFGYGFDLHENAIAIPLITPRINGLEAVDFPTSSTQLGEIILGELRKRDVVFSETAYYMQPHRKLAVIDGNFKYVYEKQTRKQFLYDVEWDPQENINLLSTEIYDTDRRRWYSQAQRTFYPHWTRVKDEAEKMRRIKDGLWRNGSWIAEFREKLLLAAKNVYSRFAQ